MINLFLPNKSDQVALLTELIFLGKEAAYRRLRGDVLFTFEEACKIAAKLGLSLDDIAKAVATKDNAIWDLEIIMPEDIGNCYTYYFDQVLSAHESFESFLADPMLITMGAFDSLPHALTLPFPEMFRFRAFEWTHHMHKGANSIKFAEVLISPSLEKRRKKLVNVLIAKNEQIFIFDRRIFISLGEQIRYFHDINLVTHEETLLLKHDLMGMINSMEILASQGRTANDKYVWIFKSNIDLNSNYTYVKGNGYEFAYSQLYQLNAVTSTDSRVCKMQRNWIESLQRYSTLISINGEKERNTFFEQQRDTINKLI